MNHANLDDRGFIQVGGEELDLWLTCERCGKSDHFTLTTAVECLCGARYDHARTPQGDNVELARLRFVPFHQGPAALADLELDPRKIAGWIALALLVLGAALWGYYVV
jgi:hypothetical protein